MEEKKEITISTNRSIRKLNQNPWFAKLQLPQKFIKGKNSSPFVVIHPAKLDGDNVLIVNLNSYKRLGQRKKPTQLITNNSEEF